MYVPSIGDTAAQRDDLQCPSVFQPPNGCVWWHLSAAGKMAACRVLSVVQRLRPDVSACPYLQPLVAMALHFIAEEDKCFGLASGLLRQRDDDRRQFVDQTKLAVTASQHSFSTVAKGKAVS